MTAPCHNSHHDVFLSELQSIIVQCFLRHRHLSLPTWHFVRYHFYDCPGGPRTIDPQHNFTPQNGRPQQSSCSYLLVWYYHLPRFVFVLAKVPRSSPGSWIPIVLSLLVDFDLLAISLSSSFPPTPSFLPFGL
jgi:hypothetical protein